MVKDKEKTIKEDIKPNCIVEFLCGLKKNKDKTITDWLLSIIKTFISERRK